MSTAVLAKTDSGHKSDRVSLSKSFLMRNLRVARGNLTKLSARILYTVCLAFALGCERSAPSSAGSTDDGAGQAESSAPNAPDDSLVSARGWSLGQSNAPLATSRFRGRSKGFASGYMILWMDTARTKQGDAWQSGVLADSIVVRGVGVNERLGPICKIGTTVDDGQTVGIVPEDNPKEWHRPRLAWRFDTAAVRIRAIPVDSFECAILPEGY